MIGDACDLIEQSLRPDTSDPVDAWLEGGDAGDGVAKVVFAGDGSVHAIATQPGVATKSYFALEVKAQVPIESTEPGRCKRTFGDLYTYVQIRADAPGITKLLVLYVWESPQDGKYEMLPLRWEVHDDGPHDRFHIQLTGTRISPFNSGFGGVRGSMPVSYPAFPIPAGDHLDLVVCLLGGTYGFEHLRTTMRNSTVDLERLKGTPVAILGKFS